MLKVKRIILFIIAIVLISTFSLATDNEISLENVGDIVLENPESTEGENATSEEEQQIPEIHNGDLYLFDNNVVMDQYVDGNVFIVGNEVNITGRVNGSLYVLADKVTLAEDSYVVQTLYICANEITLNGAANDLYSVSNKLDMSYNSFMIRDLHVSANTFNFNGGVGRDAFVYANNFNFVTETDAAAVVYGNLNYSSSNELELSQELVQGTVTYSKQGDTQTTIQSIILDKVISLASTLLYTVIVFLLALWLAPKFVEKSSSFIGKKSILAFLIGLLSCVATIIAILILSFIYIGVPLIFSIVALFGSLVSIAFAITATCITLKIKEKFKFEKKYLTIISLIVVSIILWALKQIPYAGFIISCIIAMFGLGIVVLYLFTKNKQPKKVEE